MTRPDTSALPVDVVLWDFGGVFSGSPFHAMHDYAADLGTTTEMLIDTVLGYHRPDGDHAWHRLERGEITMKEAFAEVGASAGDLGFDGFDMKAFFSVMASEPGMREAMFAGVARLRDRGLRHAIVSNNIRELAERWQALLPDGLFETIVDSSAVGCRKPDPAIYHLALERMGATPDRTAFVDDHLPNVEAAAALGIHAFHVGADPLEALATLESFIDG